MPTPTHDMTNWAVGSIVQKAQSEDLSVPTLTFLALVRIAEGLEALLTVMKGPQMWYMDDSGKIHPTTPYVSAEAVEKFMEGAPDGKGEGNTKEGPTAAL